VSGRRHLIVAAGGTAWGRVAIAARIADDLARAGHHVTVLAAEELKPVLAGRGFACVTFCRASAPLLGLLIQQAIASVRPDTIVYADYFTVIAHLLRYGPDHMLLFPPGVRTVAIDIWDYKTTGLEIDAFDDVVYSLAGGSDAYHHELWARLSQALHPVPILDHRSSATAFGNLPAVVSPRADRGAVREQYGLGVADHVVLFCTSDWQHSFFTPSSGRRLATAVPELLFRYLSTFGSAVHLVHAGPRPLPFADALSPARYHWIAKLPPPAFTALVSTSDLLLTANITGDVVGHAIRHGIPTIVVQSSFGARSVDEAEQGLGRRLTPSVARWLEGVLPLYPFVLWPAGYQQFLAPILRDNPYTDAVARVEVLDDLDFHQVASRLLFDSPARDEFAHRQARYAAAVDRLPSGAELIARPLSEELS